MISASGGAIPLTGFEQAVAIALFIVFTVGVFFTLRWVINKFATTLTDIIKLNQDHLASRDRFWQEYAQKRDADFEKRNGAVVQAVDSLTATIEKLTEHFIEHDERTANAIATMEERTKTRTRKGSA